MTKLSTVFLGLTILIGHATLGLAADATRTTLERLAGETTGRDRRRGRGKGQDDNPA